LVQRRTPRPRWVLRRLSQFPHVTGGESAGSEQLTGCISAPINSLGAECQLFPLPVNRRSRRYAAPD